MTPSGGFQNCFFCLSLFSTMLPQNQLVLGVMGVDVTLNEIQSLTPRYKVRVVVEPHKHVSFRCKKYGKNQKGLSQPFLPYLSTYLPPAICTMRAWVCACAHVHILCPYMCCPSVCVSVSVCVGMHAWVCVLSVCLWLLAVLVRFLVSS